MGDEHQDLISHVSIGTNDFDRAIDPYDAVLQTLGIKRRLEVPRASAIAYGRLHPQFWVQAPGDGRPATVGNGSHIGFVAISQETVIEFYKAGIAAEATDDGAPGPRPQYGNPNLVVFCATSMATRLRRLSGTRPSRRPNGFRRLCLTHQSRHPAMG